jgi:hypothetical protein
VRLDDQLATESRRIRLIKCDVEGAEFGVFLGGAGTIARWRPIVFTELVSEYLARYHHTTSDVFSFFGRLEYQVWETEGPKLARLVPTAGDYRGHDLLLVPKEMKIS